MVNIGETVRVHAVGRLEGGLKFLDTYKVGKPMEFAVGSRVMMPAFERVVSGMSEGERLTVTICAAEGFGEYDESLVEEIPLVDIPQADKLPVGQFIEIGTPLNSVRVKVLPPSNGMARLDHNHELAGRDLIFDVELVEVVSESAVDHERHAAGCGCGCDRLKQSLSS